MDELPKKIKKIDVLRVEYGRRKICTCHYPHFELDHSNRLVYCKDCHAIIDPYEALYKLARNFECAEKQLEGLYDQRKKIENYKPHLVVIKSLEKNYREFNYSMMPTCPHCKEPFGLEELLSVSWVNKKHVKSIR